jgi:tRNA1Val (adenine37-N6)-methyltransferase
LEFTEEIEEKYNLIVSNPPFYSADYKSENLQRDLARFSDALPFNHLLNSVSTLLSKHGVFSVIIPFKEENEFITLASKVNLFPHKILHVKGNPSSEIKRSLIAFSFNKTDLSVQEIFIETSRHLYSEEYIKLTKDFYLNM